MEVQETGLPSIHQDIRHTVHLGLLSMDGTLQCPVGQDEYAGVCPRAGVGVGWRPGEGRD